MSRDILVFSFRCLPVGGELQTSAETIAVRYFATGALPERILAFQHERLVQILNGDGRFSYHVQVAPKSAQWVHALRLLGRTVRNRLQRRPAWRPQPFTVGAFATIWDEEGRVLLLHRRDRDVWNLPGGQVEDGESPWDGCLREVHEECGLSARVKALTGVYAKPHKDELVLNFDCEVTGGRPGHSDEADQFAYCRPNALPENLLARQRERILDAARSSERKWPLVKEQGAGWMESNVSQV